MDGNGRWAKNRLMPRGYGHRKGLEATRRAVEFFAQAGVRHLTLFAFSSENWRRPPAEVKNLMELMKESLQKYTRELDEKQIRIRFIGDKSPFPDALQRQIAKSEAETRANSNMLLNIAANYGGQWEIVEASRKLARLVASGELGADEIDADAFARQLALGDSPDPDLFIRTGGEQRVSNFLLWQLAYTEFYFCDTLWPDFDAAQMQAALDEYSRRQRRYGRTDDQIEASG